ncbi:uncharacterized protein LTR77_006749 [Saxophila tyrrhenica]|uniref:CCHC-type domain-containing protein n=1 Tax=Saxophila tyrrhenica TaxID=1690608 RepID=A0AAV9P9U9_9PEZI|nr:hypothetical protein LTR77_006749 [Saxophila tyrrhenica]
MPGLDVWESAPAPTEAWKPDTTADAGGDSWQPDGAAADDGFAGLDNTSKHARGADDGGCRNCGADGHFARDCDQPRAEGGNSGECYNCGEMGHNKADCTNPRAEREFTGDCRVCGMPGHRAAECPTKPPATCKICGEEGHLQAECGVNRITHGIAALSGEDAYLALLEADKERDVDDIKKALLAYAKAYPDVTLREMEEVLRSENMATHLIARQQEVSDTHTIVNLQGQQDQKYTVSIQFSAKPRRAKFAEGYPSTPAENLERLKEAGFPMDRMVQKCSNCNQLGHGSKACPEERREFDKIKITCNNCQEEGHRMRDCTAPRKVRGGDRTCKNCGEEGHIAKECEKPRSAENVECKNCGEMGHFSRDCPSREPEVCRNCGEEGHRKSDCTNERVIQCRNCDAWGHSSRECDQPKDWSRVECSNWNEKGHGVKRCPLPPKEEEAEADGGGW